jgi:glycosyltransferase involved in cell wall biosynthesis
MKAKVSVILPTFNRANLLRRSIDSVLQQSFTDFELIIVDDCSTDTTKELISSYTDPRMRYIRNEENLGAGGARNAGVSVSEGEFIAFQDSDDEWLPNRLSIQMAVFTDNLDKNIGMVYSPYDLYIESQKFYTFGGRVKENYFSNFLLFPDVGTPTMLIKRKAWDDIGGFSLEIDCFEDWEFSLRMANKYEVVNVQEVLHNAHYSEGGVNSSSAKRMTASFYILNMYLEHFRNKEAASIKLENMIKETLREENAKLYLKLFMETAARMGELEMWEALQAMIAVNKHYF